MGWKKIDHRVPQRKLLRNTAFECPWGNCPKLWKPVKNLISTALHKKLFNFYFPKELAQKQLGIQILQEIPGTETSRQILAMT